MFKRDMTIAGYDDAIWNAMEGERQRQEDHIELIASENYASPAVLEAQGSQLTNKYAEGLPGKRYYGGCEFVDVVEELALARVKKLFHAEAANVQPHSGAQANQAVFFAALKPGDTILGMSLPEGGHLTHGSPVNVSGKWFNVIAYGLDSETELIDYESIERLAGQHKPKPRGHCRLHDQHDAQDAARSARRFRPRACRARKGHQFGGISRSPGRPADARDRRQGGGLRRSIAAGLQGIPGARARECARDGQGAPGPRSAHRFGRH